MKKLWKVSIVVFSAIILTLVINVANLSILANNLKNFWTNKESIWPGLRYDGHLEFVPSYRTNQDSGYGLEPDKNVKKAYINYSRYGESIIGGRAYTKESNEINSYNTYFIDATAWESLNPLAETTKFNYGWIYF
ncbi:MAG: hypothetical protein FWC41_07305 [Firmicutes bacterium]|nr:hypothetical protein [Bacillota bacterium]MCL2312276.1 hypothetical protein [Bacillota bacterium]